MDEMTLLRQHLRADEKLLWHGAPDPRVRFARADQYLIPFSIIWCALLIASLVAGGDLGFSRLWDIPYAAIGLYVTVGRFFYKSYRKRHAGYAITSRRALIVRHQSLADLPFRGQPVVIKRSRDARHASVSFIDALPEGRRGWRRRVNVPNTGMELLSRNAPEEFAFYDVARPEEMLRALEEVRVAF